MVFDKLYKFSAFRFNQYSKFPLICVKPSVKGLLLTTAMGILHGIWHGKCKNFDFQNKNNNNNNNNNKETHTHTHTHKQPPQNNNQITKQKKNKPLMTAV